MCNRRCINLLQRNSYSRKERCTCYFWRCRNVYIYLGSWNRFGLGYIYKS
nr:MAG TPA: hypothetical protein [Caudoviricetes sp.]